MRPCERRLRRALPILAASYLVGFGPMSARACTTFVLETPNGPVFGANLDLFVPGDGFVLINHRGVAKEGFQPSIDGDMARWVSRYGSVTFDLAGREMAFGGMNEAGLVVGSMEIRASEFPARDHRPGLTNGLWAQYVLDTCSTVEEAIAVDARVRIEDQGAPIHFLIADAQGGCATVEWFDGETVVRTGAELPVRALSNMPYERALAAYERGGPRWWWSNPGRSAERFADAHDRCVAFDPARDRDPIRYAFDTLTQVVAAPHTRWNLVYDLTARRVWFRSVRSPRVKTLALDDFELACDAPLLMLDVNADLAGEVADDFVPYDPDVSARMLYTICERFELGVPWETCVELTTHFDTFDCAR